jgi:coronin-7
MASGNDGSIKSFDKDLQESTVLKLNSKIEHFATSPSSQELLAAASQSTVSVWNINSNSCAFEVKAGDAVSQITWKSDSNYFATISSDNILRVFDPRASIEATASTACHNGIKPTKISWCGNSDLIFSAGFNSRRDREYALWDLRNFNSALLMTKLDTSTGTITPLYDSDTNLIYLCGKVFSFEVRVIQVSNG